MVCISLNVNYCIIKITVGYNIMIFIYCKYIEDSNIRYRYKIGIKIQIIVALFYNKVIIYDKFISVSWEIKRVRTVLLARQKTSFEHVTKLQQSDCFSYLLRDAALILLRLSDISSRSALSHTATTCPIDTL